MMIENYKRRAARLAALAAFTDDPERRRRYMNEKADCERLIQILQNLKEDNHDRSKVR